MIPVLFLCNETKNYKFLLYLLESNFAPQMLFKRVLAQYQSEFTQHNVFISMYTMYVHVKR